MGLEAKVHSVHVIKQVGSLEEVHGVYFLIADLTILEDRGSVYLMMQIRDRTFRSYVFRNGMTAACVVPANEVAYLDLRIGESVEFEFTIRTLDFDVAVPADVQSALDEAGLDLGVLPIRDRRQLLFMVREANSAEIRQSRIKAAVAACQDAAVAHRPINGWCDIGQSNEATGQQLLRDD